MNISNVQKRSHYTDPRPHHHYIITFNMPGAGTVTFRQGDDSLLNDLLKMSAFLVLRFVLFNLYLG